MSSPSIFIGLHEISGYFGNLREGLEKIGYRCDFVELTPHPFKYRDNISLNGIASLIRSIREKSARTQSGLMRRTMNVISNLLMFVLFLSSIRRYQVFIFTFGDSFFIKNLDLPLLKLLRKRIIMHFMGSDARPVYLDGIREFDGIDEMYAASKQQLKKIQFIERFADVIINNPAAGHFQEKPFISGFCLGIPQPNEDSPVLPLTKDGPDTDTRTQTLWTRPVRILHAPSSRYGKGTDLIRQVVIDLKEKGYPIDYMEISNRPHMDVIEAIRLTDIVIDQAYSDTPMAAFSAEAARFRVPAVVGGYYAEIISKEVPESFIPPSMYVCPEKLGPAVESLIRDEGLRRVLGERAWTFVRTQWSQREVALRYSRIISDNIPSEWWFDPNKMTYLFGYGLPSYQVKARITTLIERYGVEALGLGGKMNLTRLYLAMVEKNEPSSNVLHNIY